MVTKEMITKEMVHLVYRRINFQDHSDEGIAEGLAEVAPLIVRDRLADLLSGVNDLDAVTRAVAREQTIRNVMIATGESREIAAETLDAVLSMDQEAVLDLMDGNPTTLYEGLQRYMGELETRDELQPRDRVLRDLESLLAYPWPIATAGPSRDLEVAQDVHWLAVMIGGREVIRVDRQDGVLDAVSDTARAVHKAMTSGDK